VHLLSNNCLLPWIKLNLWIFYTAFRLSLYQCASVNLYSGAEVMRNWTITIIIATIWSSSSSSSSFFNMNQHYLNCYYIITISISQHFHHTILPIMRIISIIIRPIVITSSSTACLITIIFNQSSVSPSLF